MRDRRVLGPIVPLKCYEWWRRPGADGHLVVSANVSLDSTEDGDMVYKDYASLVIDATKTLTIANRCKGLMIVVRGDCTINGTLTMTGRGTKSAAAPTAPTMIGVLGSTPIQSITGLGLLLSKDLVTGGLSANVATNGNNGGAASEGKCGGGGSGGGSSNKTGGAGGNSTEWGGGSGGGGGSSTYGNGEAAVAYGGAGGNSGTNNYGGGGAGNPSGAGFGGAPANGTGGVLILVVGGNLTIGATGVISANGMPGGDGLSGANGGGGGSGGGRIIILYRSGYENSGSITATGGAAGQGSATYRGGAGGAGSISVNQLT